MDYGFTDVLQVTDATQAELTYWFREGTIRPDVANADGPGRHRRLSLTNCKEAQLAHVLARTTRLGAVGIGHILKTLRDQKVWDSLTSPSKREETEILRIVLWDDATLAFLKRANRVVPESARFEAWPMSRETASKVLLTAKRESAIYIDLSVISSGVEERVKSIYG